MNNEKSKIDKASKIIIICTAVFLAVLICGAAVFSKFFSNKSSANNDSSKNKVTYNIVSEEKISGSKPMEASSQSNNSSKNNSSNISSSQKVTVSFEKVTTAKESNVIKKVYSINTKFDVPEFERDVFYDTENGNTLPYRFVLPKNYDPKKKYPVILFLHGAGETGTDNEKHINNIKNIFKYSGDMVSQAFVICPQTTMGWNLDYYEDGDFKGGLASAVHLLEKLGDKYSFDENRLYVTGLSMGGHGTWSLLENYGDIFAAGIPVCGWGSTVNAPKLKDIPIRIYHSVDDPTIAFTASSNMYDAITEVGGQKVELIQLDGLGHNSWDYAYSDREGFCWLFAQNKATNPKGSYKYTPYFRVEDNKGNTIITDKDLEMLYFGGAYEGNEYVVSVNITLKETGANKFSKAYNKSKSSDVFTVYWANDKLYTYKNGKIEGNLFVIKGVFDDKNVIDFYETIKRSIELIKD